MNRVDLVDRIATEIMRGTRHPMGMAGLMIDSERAEGRSIVQVGDTEPFAVPAEDWVSPCVISVDGREVRIVAILAKHIGGGALRRLIDTIRAANLTPVIVEPVGPYMPAILKRWRWKRKIVGRGWERCEEWRPT